MAKRREVHMREYCSEPGCKGSSFWVFSSNKEQFESDEWQRYRIRKEPFLCTKHSNKSEVLSTERTRVEWMSGPVEELSYGKFFGGSSGTGLVHGDGYYAESDDFPVGTRIKVTAEVILPDDRN